MTSTRTVCTADGCGKREHARNLCAVHYRQAYLNPPPCTVDGCEKPKAYRDGLCQGHGRSLRKYGTVTRPAPATTCRVDGCEEPRAMPRAVCAEHHRRIRRTGREDGVGFSSEIQGAFLDAYRRGGVDECWEWQGTRQQSANGEPAYGLVLGRAYAHRVSYYLHHGTLPPDALVLHSCDNPPCVNPAHLRAGDHLDNVRDMVERGRHFTPWRKTT